MAQLQNIPKETASFWMAGSPGRLEQLAMVAEMIKAAPAGAWQEEGFDSAPYYHGTIYRARLQGLDITLKELHESCSDNPTSYRCEVADALDPKLQFQCSEFARGGRDSWAEHARRPLSAALRALFDQLDGKLEERRLKKQVAEEIARLNVGMPISALREALVLAPFRFDSLDWTAQARAGEGLGLQWSAQMRVEGLPIELEVSKSFTRLSSAYEMRASCAWNGGLFEEKVEGPIVRRIYEDLVKKARVAGQAEDGDASAQHAG